MQLASAPTVISPHPSRLPGALTGIELLGLVRRYAADEHNWADVVRIPTDGERWWMRLYADAAVDVWLLSWLPGQGTELHDHGDSAAAFTVVRGLVSEARIDRTGRPRSILRRTGAATSLSPGCVHDVRGAGHDAAVSVHAYSPPLDRMTYYRPVPGAAPVPVRTVLSDEPEHNEQATG